MSEWGSFATEFIGCEKCFKEVGDAFAKYRGRGTVEPQIVNKRIYAGYASGLYSGEEMNNFDGELRDLIEPNICHPVQIAVLSEAIESRAILTYTPGAREFVGHQEQRVENIARFVGAIMHGLSESERVKVFEYLQGVYYRHCGDEQPKTGRSCQCWNDE